MRRMQNGSALKRGYKTWVGQFCRWPCFPGQVYPTTTVSGLPRISAPVEHSDGDLKLRDLPVKALRMRPWPSSPVQCVNVSTRLRQWHPHRPR